MNEYGSAMSALFAASLSDGATEAACSVLEAVFDSARSRCRSTLENVCVPPICGHVMFGRMLARLVVLRHIHHW